VSVNGVLYGISPNNYIAQLTGSNTTGWQQVQINLGTLPAGTHALALGAYGNRKTSTNETTEVVVDDVLLTIEQ